ncbi:MAG: hypothetical protein ABIH77_02405 [Pseudomonadota bacterium]|nr:hypothetical protein [Gammaproteobacteria bacterium]MBU1558426.1 hypothetical protein [Gammaproteobacteria bacterium]MBU2545894.1 hypothetical protein [Gammaproteobacteria bacterium]
MRFKVFASALWIGFCLFALSACVSVEGLYVDPSFTYASIMENNIGVGGVVSVPRDLTAARQSAYANQVRAAIMQKYPGINVMPSGDLTRALSAPDYRRMMRYYRDYGVVQDEYLKTAHRHIKRMRYVAFARIVEDQISHNRTQEDPGPHTRGSVTMTTTLTMKVNMVVYDLNNDRMVWSGAVTESNENNNHYDMNAVYVGRHHRHDVDKQIVASLANTALQEMQERQYHYPSAPAANDLLNGIFSGLLTKFPVPPKQQ